MTILASSPSRAPTARTDEAGETRVPCERDDLALRDAAMAARRAMGLQPLRVNPVDDRGYRDVQKAVATWWVV